MIRQTSISLPIGAQCHVISNVASLLSQIVNDNQTAVVIPLLDHSEAILSSHSGHPPHLDDRSISNKYITVGCSIVQTPRAQPHHKSILMSWICPDDESHMQTSRSEQTLGVCILSCSILVLIGMWHQIIRVPAIIALDLTNLDRLISWL